jgi:hypothetical protein
MNATPMQTEIPLRDKLVGIVEGRIEELWDSDGCSCEACRKSIPGWCDDHAAAQARLDELEPVARKLWAAATDAEARVIAARVPEAAVLLTGTGVTA